MRDIAKRLGVSHSTVSMAMRDNPRISQEVREKVRQTASEMNYTPDPMMSALIHHRQSRVAPPRRTVLAWLNAWPDPKQLRAHREFDFYWKGACGAAAKFGYHLEEFTYESSSTRSLEKALREHNVQGIFIPPQLRVPDWGTFKWERFCVVRFGRSSPEPRVHIVTSDQVANSMLALRKIQERGYSRVGFVTRKDLRNVALFKTGFLGAQSHLPEKLQLPPLVLEEINRGKDLEDLIRWLRKNQPEAILTDIAALHGMLEEAGYRVPQDIALAATSVLDGNADAGIDQNAQEIGRVAFLLLLSLMNDGARGIPPIFRQILIEGAWVDGSTLPDRS